MKIIRNNIIPFKGFRAINLCGLLFVRKEAVITKVTINHEKIHSAQMREVLWIFYLLYCLEWFIRLLCYFSFKQAYKNISFEREAYANQSNMEYLKTRKHYSWISYI